MYSIIVNNVNQAFVEGLTILACEGAVEHTRNGDAIALEGPMLTTYTNPRRRVLFHERRDANPFFHLMEAIWMLAGRSDAAWPTLFNKQMATYANEQGRYDGAYGHRWRTHFGYDQIEDVVDQLTIHPNTRRAIITMYDPNQDDNPDSKDIPCNTHIYFRIRGAALDMTVCCRSNDAVWGAYGANAVHMSMLQELIAAGVGVSVGRYHQFSNNFHLYTDPHVELLQEVSDRDEDEPHEKDLYHTNGWACYPICTCYDGWLEDAEMFLDQPHLPNRYHNDFFTHVAWPMYMAWLSHKDGNADNALSWASQIEAKDWSHACTQWLKRRQK